MLYSLQKSIKELNAVLDKLNDNSDDIEAMYLQDKVVDKDGFKNSIQEAIQNITKAYEKSTNKISSTYPCNYEPYKGIEWVDKEEFDKLKGKELESGNVEFGLIVIRYEYGEHFLYQDGQKYGIYKK
jgi:hypothetical protein